MLAMVNWTEAESNRTQPCGFNYTLDIVEKNKPSSYSWSFFIQSQILASYCLGSAAAHIPAEMLSNKVNPKWPPLVGTLIASLCNFFTPLFADLGKYYLISIQIIKGMGQAFILPSFYAMMSNWLPGNAVGNFMGCASIGLPVGGFFTLLLAAVINEQPSHGWQYTFYYSGALGIVWCACWFYMVCEYFFPTPLIFGSEPIGKDSAKISSMPIWSVITSMSVWAYILTGIATYSEYSFSVLLLPSFMRKVFKIRSQMNAYLSSIPQLLQGLLFLATVLLMDRILPKMFKHVLRKICVVGSLSVFMGCFILLSFTGCDLTTSPVVLVLAFGFIGLNLLFLQEIPSEISPKFSGYLSCFMSTLGDIAGFVFLISTGYTIDSEQEKLPLEQWRKVLVAVVLLNAIAIIVFLASGSSQMQPWSESSSEEDRSSGLPIEDQEELSE